MMLSRFHRSTAPRRASRGRGRTRQPQRAVPELLEVRYLLSEVTWPGLTDPQQDAEPNETLDAAQDIGRVRLNEPAGFVGHIGDGDLHVNDVDWIRFTLETAGRVQMTPLPDADGAASLVVLTLYGDQLAEFDPSVPLQHRLLGRCEIDADGNVTQIDQQLDAGTYFAAISGAGNRFFHPFIADSGLRGVTTAYGIRVELTEGSAAADAADQFAPAAESSAAGDDTPHTAGELGELNSLGHLQLSGTIGDDPFYDVASEDPFAMNPAADVDLFHFTIAGNGQFALVAQAFAGRIGSPLDPALTLYRADETGSLQFVGTNDNTLNPTVSTNDFVPLFSDAALFAGLTAGDYFLAVSAASNDPTWGPDGVFDPLVSHSGLNGGAVGNYVLDLLVYPDEVAPHVVATTPADDSTLDAPPRQIELQFSEPVNMQELAYTAFVQVNANTVRAVFVEASDGTRYFPRLRSFDAETNTARFLMLDGLPNGEFTLHVSGALGLTDLAGHPIAANDASGDFVVQFRVDGADHGRSVTPGHDALESAQDLGVLFPHELQASVIIERPANSDNGDTADYFRLEVLQAQNYFFTRTNPAGDSPAAINILDTDGNELPLAAQPDGSGLIGFLPAGSYVLRVGPWDAAASSDVTYQIEIELGGAGENPTPLTSGAAPAAGIHLIASGSAAAGSSASPVFVRTMAQAFGTNPQAVSPVALRGVTVAADSTPPSGLFDGLGAAALGSRTTTNSLFADQSRTGLLVQLLGFDPSLTRLALSNASERDGSDSERSGGTGESSLLDLWAGLFWDRELPERPTTKPADESTTEAATSESNSESSAAAGDESDGAAIVGDRANTTPSAVDPAPAANVTPSPAPKREARKQSPASAVGSDNRDAMIEKRQSEQQPTAAIAWPIAAGLLAAVQSLSRDPAAAKSKTTSSRTRRDRHPTLLPCPCDQPDG